MDEQKVEVSRTLFCFVVDRVEAIAGVLRVKGGLE
jgi:hypothetical protein